MALALAPGTRLPQGAKGYGQQPGHQEETSEMVRGSTTMCVGCLVCCCTCCPFGFIIPLDKQTRMEWVMDGHGSLAAPSQVPPMAVPASVAPPAAAATVLSVRCGGTCGQIIQVQPQGPGLVQFNCPHCGAINQVSYAPTPPGQLEVSVPLPDWWKSKPPMGESVLVPVANDDIKAIQTLIDDTWKDITTRDRGYKKPQKLCVVQVQQNCNPRLWSNYVRARRQIAERMGNEEPISSRTSQVIQEKALNLGQLEPGVNEFLLFHGTKPSACDSICKSDFMIQLAGSNAGALYGPGIYFGENSSKSDEYAMDDSSGIYAGLYAMLLSRVTCGRMLVTEEVSPDTNKLRQQCSPGGGFDSVLGDREKARGTYREFVVYNNDQAYPEFVVIYRREDA